MSEVRDHAIPSSPLQELAPAKVNLFLEVFGRRADGYHEIETFLVQVGLCDTLSVEEIAGTDLQLQVFWEETTAAKTYSPLSAGPENLVWRAAELLRQRTGCRRGARLILKKRIPVAAGLGGGSSDAAAALRSLNRLWQLALPTPELTRLASCLGSDVPFFLNGPAAWCRGRGELVETFPCPLRCWFLLVCPYRQVSTARVYAEVRPPNQPHTGSVLNELLRNGDVPALRRRLFNRLEEAALTAYPELRRIRQALDDCGLSHARLSGSGGTFFALFASCDEAQQAAEEFQRCYKDADIEPVRVLVAASLTTPE